MALIAPPTPSPVPAVPNLAGLSAMLGNTGVLQQGANTAQMTAKINRLLTALQQVEDLVNETPDLRPIAEAMLKYRLSQRGKRDQQQQPPPLPFAAGTAMPQPPLAGPAGAPPPPAARPIPQIAA